MLTPEDEQLLGQLAHTISRWHMEVPAIFWLEMSKPLSFVASQFMVVIGPLMHTFFVEQQYDRLAELIGRRDNVEYLLCLIEQEAAGKDNQPK